MKHINEMLEEFNEVTEHLDSDKRAKALEIFLNSRTIHVKLFGSYAKLQGQEYINSMRVRQKYQIDNVKDYVRGHKK